MRNQKDTPEAPDLYKKQMHQKVRYSEDLYRDIIGQTHQSEQKVVWLHKDSE
ncbi:hypothetical protein HZP39_03270 [Elizabethkingia anophelis]|nr:MULTISPECIES: hypothetical protein [Elizabethkingia]EJG2050274.1 hypothetical protein [Elizabethkingia anophelis]EJG2058879.1 hypothetical protein [Elizabethkingia anophelis]EJG2062547.1 hypothetical protein [Elizabethkingia anophelis]EJG2066349.1 hypothetical protein [Elizabethkingia anophelis]EJG2070273.1 hypothetical protein [Elizabethkingia anophelis]